MVEVRRLPALSYDRGPRACMRLPGCLFRCSAAMDPHPLLLDL